MTTATNAADTTTDKSSDDKKDDDAKVQKKGPDYPEREKDGCTHCGAILTIRDDVGNVNFAASEAAQQRHMENRSCVATPNFVDPTEARKVDPKTGKIAGEYAAIKRGE